MVTDAVWFVVVLMVDACCGGIAGILPIMAAVSFSVLYLL